MYVSVTIGRIAALLAILWSAVRTVSFGVWVWKQKNRTGALAIFVVALISIVLPSILLFFR